MKKRILYYCFDFLDGQAAWLNQMASRGWRLAGCHTLTYEFESCRPGSYEYAVELVSDQTAEQADQYRALLESLGYRVWTKNLNVNYAIGHVRWRPWVGAGRAGVAATSGIGNTSRWNQELFVVERPAEGSPFQLHTSLEDRIKAYRKVRRAYAWGTAAMLTLAVLTVVQTAQGACAPLPGGVLLALLLVFAVLWGGPALRLTARLRELTRENQIHE